MKAALAILAAACAILFVVPESKAQKGDEGTKGSDANRCTALSRVSIPDVEITSAALTPAGRVGRGGGAVPEHCLVRGSIDKRVGFGSKPFAIGFEMRLPVKWERRFLFQGGGGMDGTVRPALGNASGANANPALARGFAVVSTDAGHTGAPPMPEADASFARDQQARIDNAYRSIERVTQVSKLIAMQYYGELWRHAYFDGRVFESEKSPKAGRDEVAREANGPWGP